MKRFPHCMSSRKCKLKNNEIPLNTHQNDHMLTVWNDRNWFIAGGNAKYSHLGKNVLSTVLQLCFLVFTQMSWKLTFTQNLAHEFSSLFHDCRKLEAIQMFFSNWVDKSWDNGLQWLIQIRKQMNYQATKKEEGNLNAYS